MSRFENEEDDFKGGEFDEDEYIEFDEDASDCEKCGEEFYSTEDETLCADCREKIRKERKEMLNKLGVEDGIKK